MGPGPVRPVTALLPGAVLTTPTSSLSASLGPSPAQADALRSPLTQGVGGCDASASGQWLHLEAGGDSFGFQLVFPTAREPSSV